MADDVTIDPDRIYLNSAAARLLGVSASTLRDLERRGKIEGTRTPGGQRRFTGSALLQLRAESNRVHSRTSRPAADSTATDADAKTRQAWLGQVMAQAQRALPADTSAEIRLRLGADVERALGHFGPTSSMDAVEPLVKSLVERARLQGEKAQEEAERREMKGELVDCALAELRRRIDALSKRVVGAPGSLKRRHVQATLHDQLRDRLQKRLRGDEDWARFVTSPWSSSRRGMASRLPTRASRRQCSSSSPERPAWPVAQRARRRSVQRFEPKRPSSRLRSCP